MHLWVGISPRAVAKGVHLVRKNKETDKKSAARPVSHRIFSGFAVSATTLGCGGNEDAVFKFEQRSVRF